MLHLNMVISILILTAVKVYGEFVQSALQESGSYSASLVDNLEGLYSTLKTEQVEVVVLDMVLVPDPIALVGLLTERDPKLVIIFFNVNDSSEETLISKSNQIVTFTGVLRVPDLIQVLDNLDLKKSTEKRRITKGSEADFQPKTRGPQKNSIHQTSPDWLGNVTGVAQVLTQLTLESAAHAALITKNVELWAYAGHLSRPAAEELAQSLWGLWDRDNGNDLAQFIRLESTHREYMLYATGLGGEYVLGLAFETFIPFSEMRMQAGVLAKKLTTPPNGLTDTTEPKNLSVPEDIYRNLLGTDKPVVNNHRQENKAETKVTNFLHDWQRDDELSNGRQAFFENLIEGVEIPDPDGFQSPKQIIVADAEVEESSGMEKVPGNTNEIIEEQKNPPPSARNENWKKSTVPGSLKDSSRVTDSLISEEKNNTIFEGAKEFDLGNQRKFDRLRKEKVDQNSNELAYTCVLVPRIPHHYLVGDLAKSVKGKIELHAVAYGWRLEGYKINPKFLQWVAVLSPDLAPGKMVKRLRKQISKEIFSEFPRLARENPSGDFWAPGFLIVNSTREIPDAILNRFLKTTRSRQGVNIDQSKPTK